MQTTRRHDPGDRTGRTIGLVVFLLGVALLVVVFAVTYSELAGGSIAQLVQSGAGETNFNAVFAALLKGLFLVVMGYLASAIASRGIGLYQASRAVEEGT